MVKRSPEESSPHRMTVKTYPGDPSELHQTNDAGEEIEARKINSSGQFVAYLRSIMKMTVSPCLLHGMHQHRQFVGLVQMCFVLRSSVH